MLDFRDDLPAGKANSRRNAGCISRGFNAARRQIGRQDGGSRCEYRFLIQQSVNRPANSLRKERKERKER